VNRLAAALYDRALAGTESAGLARWRRGLLAELAGRVLEIGAGTGRNLDHYPAAVTELVLAEPDPHMRHRLQRRAAGSTLPVRVVDASAEDLPFPDGRFDAVVSTLVLCSVRHPQRAAAELRRVLGANGQLVVIEHVAAAPGSRRARWQARLEPAWKRAAGNCHLTRDTASTLVRAGFDPSGLQAEDLPRVPPVLRPSIRGRLATAGLPPPG
jgi:ubiquinone/menaquinone biosynthesis C-methylase UbiE